MNALNRHMDPNTTSVDQFACLANWTEREIMVAVHGLKSWLQNQNLYQTNRFLKQSAH